MSAEMETDDIAAQVGDSKRARVSVTFQSARQTLVATEYVTLLDSAAVPMASCASAAMKTNSSRQKPAAPAHAKTEGDASTASATVRKVSLAPIADNRSVEQMSTALAAAETAVDASVLTSVPVCMVFTETTAKMTTASAPASEKLTRAKTSAQIKYSRNTRRKNNAALLLARPGATLAKSAQLDRAIVDADTTPTAITSTSASISTVFARAANAAIQLAVSFALPLKASTLTRTKMSASRLASTTDLALVTSMSPTVSALIL
ncbi:unnamed protein product [Oikopleura dioica]|uniref:Uncharacterized protein n=1 Tax=Oikopleura dioica TaxID=34765 RepID=E4YE76_OIKDI|nr:unnamed protein product [Oikopleura dioica]